MTTLHRCFRGILILDYPSNEDINYVYNILRVLGVNICDEYFIICVKNGEHGSTSNYCDIVTESVDVLYKYTDFLTIYIPK